MAIGQGRRCEITEAFKITSSHKYFTESSHIAFSGRAEFRGKALGLMLHRSVTKTCAKPFVAKGAPTTDPA